jgi:hypothetical protein
LNRFFSTSGLYTDYNICKARELLVAIDIDIIRLAKVMLNSTHFFITDRHWSDKKYGQN